MKTPIEFVIAAYPDENKAGEVLRDLKQKQKNREIFIINAAVMKKDQYGQVSVTETEDVDARRGAIFGAITGGLIGLLGGPAGAIVGAAAGAATGGIAGKRIDMGFSDQSLSEIQESLKPNSSAVIALIEHEWVERVVEELEQFGAKLFRQALKDEIAAQLKTEEDDSKPDQE